MKPDPVAFIREGTEVLPPPLVPEIALHLATENTPLWQMTEERLYQHDLPLPFWAFAWPGGQGMARYILDHSGIVRGKRVLDLAAGCGIAAIAAMKAGAKSALAVDSDPLALEAVRLNAENNKVIVDVSGGIDLGKIYAKADVIVAGDICYQQAMAATLTRWLRLCACSDVPVLLADPGRAYVPQENMVNLARYDVPTARAIEDCDLRSVTVWRMEKL